MNVKEIENIVDGLLDEYGYKRTFPIRVNKRLRTSMARVCYDAFGITAMEFAEYMMTEDVNSNVADDSIKHECAHVLAYLATGKHHGHDKYWKSWCLKVGCNPQATAAPEEGVNIVEAKRKAGFKYMFKCADCGQIVAQYKSKNAKCVQHPERYRSGCCNAPLEEV